MGPGPCLFYSPLHASIEKHIEVLNISAALEFTSGGLSTHGA
jgi:hypothetical protein